jgi:hypothetical protein
MNRHSVTALLLVVFSAHFVWEMAQAKWFASMWGLDFWYATWLCTRASIADLLLTLLIYAVVAVVLRSRFWFLGRHVIAGTALFLVLAWIVTAAIELWALGTGRWEYAPSMVTIAGIGIAPLLQWTLIPIALIALARALAGRARDEVR